MKRKTMSLIISVIVLIGVLVEILFFVNKEFGDGVNQEESEQELQEKEAKETKFRQEEQASDIKYHMGDAVETRGYSYTVEKVEITKNSHGYRAPEGMMPLEERSKTTLDEEGNIMNEYSYVYVYLKIKHMENIEDELDVGNCRFVVEGKADFETEHCGSFQYYGREDPGMYGKDYGHIAFLGQEEQSLILVFVQRDDEVTGQNIYLHINPQGGYEEGVKNEVERWILLND